MNGARIRPAWAEIDLGAVRHNASVLARLAAPAALCAVVKADAYGHGAVAVARAAVDGGATWLAVALVDEGVELRRARDHRAPSWCCQRHPPTPSTTPWCTGSVTTVYSAAGAHGRRRCGRPGRRRGADVHVKVDTGMHRVGASPSDLASVVRTGGGRPPNCASRRCGRIWRCRSRPTPRTAPFTEGQLDASRRRCEPSSAAAGLPPPMMHAANSGAAIAYAGVALGHGAVRDRAVRRAARPRHGSGAGSAAAGGRALAGAYRSRPGSRGCASSTRANALPTAVAARCRERSVVATVPIGYADGVPRRYFTEGGTVLIGGRRCPLAGTVTMDQIVVDCGPGTQVWPSGTRSSSSGRQGAETLQRPGLGRYPRNHRVRGPVRHRSAGAPPHGGQCRGRRRRDMRSGLLSRRNVARAVALGAGAAAAAGWTVQHRLAARAVATADDIAREGLTLPDDVVHHDIEVDDGGRIHVVERGTGPAIVLLHGIMLRSDLWAHALRDLSPHHRVIAIDLRGHGKSVPGRAGFSAARCDRTGRDRWPAWRPWPPPGRDRRGSAGWPSDVTAVLDALEVDHAVVVGHSMGGLVALQLVSDLGPGAPAPARRRLGAGVDVRRAVLVSARRAPAWPGWRPLSRRAPSS